MKIAKTIRAISKAVSAFYSASPNVAIFVICMLVVFCFVLCIIAFGNYQEFSFNRLSPAEHFRLGKAAFEIGDYTEAERQLRTIQNSGSEHDEAAGILSAIQKQRELQRKAAAMRTEDARERMLGNMAGKYHDEFKCSISTDNKPIVSFDSGVTWWLDDGRCAVRSQKQRDADANVNSYWPTTVRVDTDMDSFWLNHEERTCQTAPDDKGRVSVVACSPSGNHRAHNIPVKFWGGVDRNTVSDWKCERDGEDFVCKAIN